MGTPLFPSIMALLQRVNTWTQNQTFAGRVFFGVGSTAYPGITFSNDTDTGIRRSNINQFSIVTGGAERLVCDGNGGVQIGGIAAASGYTGNGALTGVSTEGARFKNTAKAFGCISISGGVPTLLDGFNISSITDTGVGRITPNYTNAVTDTNYTVAATVKHISVSNAETVTCVSKATGSCELNTLRYSAGMTDLDGGQVNFIVMGN